MKVGCRPDECLTCTFGKNGAIPCCKEGGVLPKNDLYK